MSAGTTVTSPATREPFAWVAWIRLVAVLGVISIHAASETAAAAARGDVRADTVVAVLLFRPFVVAVPLFVMVSGVLTLDPDRFRGTSAYLRKRVLRTVPAVVFWHGAYIAFLQLWYYPRPLTTTRVVQLVLTGRITPHLYFLWITLGLSLLAPILVRWLAQAGRREQLITASALAALAPLSTATRDLRGSSAVAVETPWTWWIAYLGLFILGWALRDVVLRGLGLVTVALVTGGLLTLFILQNLAVVRSPGLQRVSPVGYYSITVVLAAVGCFLLARSTIRPSGWLSLLARPSVVRWVDPVAKASLGIFACHFMVMLTLTRLGYLAGPVLTAGQLVARIALVSVFAITITLCARRVPLVRQVF